MYTPGCKDIPLSLYIHLPWCVRKCPYCDFNSHESKGTLPEALYVEALLDELDQRLPLINLRPLVSIFFGGGTPSLFSAQTIAQILEGVTTRCQLAADCEITLEANPGTIDQVKFKDFYQAGINRLSLGVQSLQNDKLQALGRIHDREHAIRAIENALQAGFTNFNIDLMYGLPGQSIEDALSDLTTAMSFSPTHLSWYQLTIEPNTVFYRYTPTLPMEEVIWHMQLAGQAYLKKAGLQQYEVSAYSQPARTCRHNLNYWEFGDYLGLGAGAHSKITNTTGEVIRFAQIRQPNDYLLAEKRRLRPPKLVGEHDLIFEFMLNALRLTEGVSTTLFTERTGLSIDTIQPVLAEAQQRGLILKDPHQLCATPLGKRFLNDLTSMFLV